MSKDNASGPHYGDTMRSSLLLIANPAAKGASGNRIEQAAMLFQSEGYDVNISLTGKKGDAEEYAREAARKGIPLIVAAGGDGTFNEVINGIVHTDTSMAILPMGTTNVLAKELGIPEDVEGAVKKALAGKVRTVSLGKIDLIRATPAISRYFCLMAGIGFDGETVHAVNEAWKKYSGKGAYIFSGLKTLIGYSPRPLTFLVDGETFSGFSAIIGKASKYGGHYRVTPDADLGHPQLSLIIMQGKRRSDIIRYVWGIMQGSHLRMKDIIYRRARTVRVEGSARIQIDGDYLGETPAVINVIPDALRLIV